ncbi:MAG: hypothetical protein WD472_05200, partial [Dehalococcoidia bacterium]
MFNAPRAAEAAFFVVVDQQGANDVPAQSDLTRMGRDDSDASYLKLFWSWDSTDQWNGTGQTGDACSLFDTDGDGNVNFAVCGEIHNTSASVIVQGSNPSPTVWVCTDAKNDRCTQPTGQAFTSAQVTCAQFNTMAASPPANLITATDPFPTGSNYPNDSTLQCNILKSFLPTGAILVNVCSYPSIGNGGNNNPFDCITTPGDGFLVIKKEAGSDTSTNFVFAISPAPPAPEPSSYTVVGTGQTAPIGQAVGATNSVTETIPSGWNLVSASCVKEGGTSTGTFNGTDAVTGIQIESGKTTTCTFTNSLHTATFTVNKNFTDKPGTDTTPVSVTLTCGGGTIVGPNPKNASEAAPAVFSVTGLSANTTCTAAESPVPAGYTASGCTTPVTLTPTGSASCTITNTLNSATFTVFKNFTDKPGTDTTTVSVTLTCGAGTIVAPNPKPASEASPAVFTVTGLAANTTCTAAESPVPSGYTASGCTTPVTLTPNGTGNCTITNTLNSATFTVRKNFTDKPGTDTTTVSVTLTCGAGMIVAPNPKPASEASPAVFTVNGLDANTTCTAAESPVPDGYTASGCTAPVTLTPNGTGECTITNTLNSATFTV